MLTTSEVRVFLFVFFVLLFSGSTKSNWAALSCVAFAICRGSRATMTTTSVVWAIWWASGGRKWTTGESGVSSRLRPAPASAARAPPLPLPPPPPLQGQRQRRPLPLEIWRGLRASSSNKMLRPALFTYWPHFPPWGASSLAMTPVWSPGPCSCWRRSWSWVPCGRSCSYQVLWLQPPCLRSWEVSSTDCSGAGCVFC